MAWFITIHRCDRGSHFWLYRYSVLAKLITKLHTREEMSLSVHTWHFVPCSMQGVECRCQRKTNICHEEARYSLACKTYRWASIGCMAVYKLGLTTYFFSCNSHLLAKIMTFSFVVLSLLHASHAAVFFSLVVRWKGHWQIQEVKIKFASSPTRLTGTVKLHREEPSTQLKFTANHVLAARDLAS